MTCSPVRQERAERRWSNSTDPEIHLKSGQGRISSLRQEGALQFSRSFCLKSHGHVPHGGTAPSPRAGAHPHLGPVCRAHQWWRPLINAEPGAGRTAARRPRQGSESNATMPLLAHLPGAVLPDQQRPGSTGPAGREVKSSDEHWSRLFLSVFATSKLWSSSSLLSIKTEGLIDIPTLSRAE